MSTSESLAVLDRGGCALADRSFSHFTAFLRLVIETLTEAHSKNPSRKCFRLIGGVLVERTVKDVLPALKTNSDGVSLDLSCAALQHSSIMLISRPVPLLSGETNAGAVDQAIRRERERTASVRKRIWYLAAIMSHPIPSRHHSLVCPFE